MALAVSGATSECASTTRSEITGKTPVELLLRSKNYFQFMEPVSVEFRIRNIADLPLEMDAQLNPEYGGVTVYIRRPDGRILEYSPILCKLANPDLKVLKPRQGSIKGEDRHSQVVLLSYGGGGHYFNEPGEYIIRAVYQGAGDVLIPSNLHRIRIGRPFSEDEERIAQDYFSNDAGMALSENGDGYFGDDGGSFQKGSGWCKSFASSRSEPIKTVLSNKERQVGRSTRCESGRGLFTYCQSVGTAGTRRFNLLQHQLSPVASYQGGFIGGYR